MRGATAVAIGRKLAGNPSNLSISRQTLIPFSTSSNGGGGGGRGRGRGGPSPSGPPRFDFAPQHRVPGQPELSDEPKPDPSAASSPGLGHGRGKPLPSSKPLPSFSNSAYSAAGRGQPGHVHPSPPARDPVATPAKPIVFARENGSAHALPGGGRGKPMNFPGPEVQIKEENRHVQARPDAEPGQSSTKPKGPKLTREEAVIKALGILGRGGAEGVDIGSDGGGRGGGRGRGTRGRGRGRGRENFRVSDRRGDNRGKGGKEGEGEFSGLYLGDNADGEKLAKKLGPEIMNQLVEGFEEMSNEVLPSQLDDVYVDALHTNLMIECEPEYLMGDFNKNPDIDETPPISLRDALEKMKPFLMAYEGIESQEEWEEVMKETMERVPLLKEIVDHYSGPNRVTAKKQQQELERVAKTLPANVPDSVKQFANRAVLSLQSNPGWGFDRKCQFMDKLVAKVSQHYK